MMVQILQLLQHSPDSLGMISGSLGFRGIIIIIISGFQNGCFSSKHSRKSPLPRGELLAEKASLCQAPLSLALGFAVATCSPGVVSVLRDIRYGALREGATEAGDVWELLRFLQSTAFPSSVCSESQKNPALIHWGKYDHHSCCNSGKPCRCDSY